MADSDLVVIYVPGSKEWYREEGLGLTPNRAEAHVYRRRTARMMVGTDSQVEIQDANPVLAQGRDLEPKA